MDKSDWLFVLISSVLIALALSWGITSEIVFKEGAKTSRLYYEATGHFPPEQWLKSNNFKGYDAPQEILETLKPY